jgi:hypothetical protein
MRLASVTGLVVALVAFATAADDMIGLLIGGFGGRFGSKLLEQELNFSCLIFITIIFDKIWDVFIFFSFIYFSC